MFCKSSKTIFQRHQDGMKTESASIQRYGRATYGSQHQEVGDGFFFSLV